MFNFYLGIKPGSFSPALFLEMGCLMKARSFWSMLKNMEMALGIDNVNSYRDSDHNHIKFWLEVCFKSSEEATHESAASEVRKM